MQQSQIHSPYLPVSCDDVLSNEEAQSEREREAAKQVQFRHDYEYGPFTKQERNEYDSLTQQERRKEYEYN